MREIPGYEGYYSINKNGRVWSHSRVVKSIFRRWNHYKEISLPIKGRFLIPNPDATGYLGLSFLRDGRQKHVRIHRLVAENFIPRVEGKNDVNHKNGLKTDNRIKNLEWVTKYENRRHAVDTGLWKSKNPSRGINRYNSKLNDDVVREIRSLYPKKTLKQIGDIYGISWRTVWDVVTRRSWKHVQ